MNLSKRLQSIASLLKDSLVYDVGCDHGLLDIYLTLYNNCKCVCIDVSNEIISRAIKNIKKYNLEDKIDVRVGNGFEKLELNESSTLVLAGMGTQTIIKIISKNKTNTVICQTNTDIYELRKKVCENGYYIEDEKIVFENNRYYVTIKFCKGKSNYTYEELLIGIKLKQEKLFRKYIENLYKKNKKAYEKSIEFNNNKEIQKQMEIIKKYRL